MMTLGADKRKQEANRKAIKRQADQLIRQHRLVIGKEDTGEELPPNYVEVLCQWFLYPAPWQHRHAIKRPPTAEEMLKAFLDEDWLIECLVCGPSHHHLHCDHCGSAFAHSAFIGNPVDQTSFCSFACLAEG